MAARRCFLDGNIYNLLATEPELPGRNRSVAGSRHGTAAESVPTWFTVVVQPEGIAISGLARSGMARSSGGAMYRQHIGESKQGFDAILAHSAHSMGAT